MKNAVLGLTINQSRYELCFPIKNECQSVYFRFIKNLEVARCFPEALQQHNHGDGSPHPAKMDLNKMLDPKHRSVLSMIFDA